LTTAATGGALVFTNTRGESFDVSTSGDISNQLGLGSFKNSSATGAGAAGTFDYSTLTGVAGTFAVAGTETLEISVGGGAKQTLAITLVAGAVGEAVGLINNAIASNTTLAAAGLVATNVAGQINIASTNASNFRVASLGSTNVLGFNNSAAAITGVLATATTISATTTPNTFDAGGAQQSALIAFTPIRNGGDDQTITLTSDNTNGVQQSLTIVLRNDATPNARSLDEAIDTINNQILQSNNTTMQKIVAVKEHSAITGADGIKFLSTSAFQVSDGTNSGATGLGSQGTLVASAASAGGSTADISNAATAASAVNALATSVSLLGAAQAVVGKGQNQFNYAVNLAQSQLTNLAAAESRIRDADLAAEAANLTKAQILLQAGTAAVAQANSSSQAVLALLR